jgi:hypothetical protein
MASIVTDSNGRLGLYASSSAVDAHVILPVILPPATFDDSGCCSAGRWPGYASFLWGTGLLMYLDDVPKT